MEEEGEEEGEEDEGEELHCHGHSVDCLFVMFVVSSFYQLDEYEDIFVYK